MASNENLAPAVIGRVAREIRSILDSKPEGIRLIPNEDDITDIRAVIDGPVGTPYEGGQFKMKLVLGRDFPQAPPKGYFLTKIFHPNVSSTGEICVNTLKRDWDPSHGINHVLIVVKCLLINPNPESALNEEAGMMLLEQYPVYAKRARLMTQVHAMKGKASSTSTAKTDATEATSTTELKKRKVSSGTAGASKKATERKISSGKPKKGVRRL